MTEHGDIERMPDEAGMGPAIAAVMELLRDRLPDSSPVPIRTPDGILVMLIDTDRTMGAMASETELLATIEAMRHREHVVVLDAASAGRETYLTEGHSSCLGMEELFALSARDFAEGMRGSLKSDLHPARPDQEKGFYRKFEKRRPDGSVSRGRRR